MLPESVLRSTRAIVVSAAKRFHDCWGSTTASQPAIRAATAGGGPAQNLTAQNLTAQYLLAKHLLAKHRSAQTDASAPALADRAAARGLGCRAAGIMSPGCSGATGRRDHRW